MMRKIIASVILILAVTTMAGCGEKAVLVVDGKEYQINDVLKKNGYVYYPVETLVEIFDLNYEWDEYENVLIFGEYEKLFIFPNSSKTVYGVLEMEEKYGAIPTDWNYLICLTKNENLYISIKPFLKFCHYEVDMDEDNDILHITHVGRDWRNTYADILTIVNKSAAWDVMRRPLDGEEKMNADERLANRRDYFLLYDINQDGIPELILHLDYSEVAFASYEAENSWINEFSGTNDIYIPTDGEPGIYGTDYDMEYLYRRNIVDDELVIMETIPNYFNEGLYNYTPEEYEAFISRFYQPEGVLGVPTIPENIEKLRDGTLVFEWEE